MRANLYLYRLSCCGLLLATSTAISVLAQAAGGKVSGRLTNSLSLDPVSGATVTLEELHVTATTASDGTYTLENLPPGKYHLAVKADGYAPRRQEVTVSGALSVDVVLDPELHYSEVVSVSPQPRNQFESYQPTSVLAGQDLDRQLQGTLGATLEAQPGIALRSFGPGPARPVIRGLDGDRVLILEDGQRMGDLSSQSGDHGVNVNPAAATRLEVVRGPATLLYGANAIGGLVNVISNEIPNQRLKGVSGTATTDLGTAAEEGGGSGEVTWGNGSFAIHGGGSGRRAGDVKTPDGTIENSQSRAGFGNVGASWTGEHSFVGGSYSYDDTKYGIPLIEAGNVQLTPRRHSVTLRAEGQQLTSFIDSYRASVGIRRYKHDELEGDEIGTSFTNDTNEVELLVTHRAYGRLKGTIGGWGLTRAFSASGEEALSPPVDQRGAAAFFYEEATWPHVTFQFGARFDHAGFTPEGGLPNRDFDNFSGSVGILTHPNDAITIAASFARASRNPALEELYFDGPHGGNFAFEVGNPNLDSEHARGLDLSFRWRHSRASGELTYFYNNIKDFIFRQPTGEIEEDLPVVNFVAADSVLQGVESHIDGQLTSWLSGEFGLDYVRGTLQSTDEPLPRIPPLRAHFGLRYQKNAFRAGGEVVTAAKQDRVFENETPTDGYNLLKLFALYSIQTGHSVSTITARLDNATNELYRNHLSFIKDFVPEMGRNFKLIYSVKF